MWSMSLGCVSLMRHTHLAPPYCALRYYAHKGELAGTANALKLVKALKNKMWESTTQQCRYSEWLRCYRITIVTLDRTRDHVKGLFPMCASFLSCA